MTARPAVAGRLRDVHMAAVERKRGRRVEVASPTARERAQALLDGRTLPAVDWNAPGFAEARTLGDWLDDRLTDISPWPYAEAWTAVVFAVAEAARAGGPAAAAAAVAGARNLPGADQYRAWHVLSAWRGRRDQLAEAAMNAVASEWKRLRLAETEPDSGK